MRNVDLMRLFDLSGKTALVTGSSRGIGAAIALGLAEAGADLAVHYAGSRVMAEAISEEIRSMGRRSTALPCRSGGAGRIRSAL